MKVVTNQSTLVCLLALCVSSSARGDESSIAQRPLNIILIVADDLGYETIEVNGGQSYRTPNINQLAASGVSFEHCYAQPLCTPSRVKLMTGKYNVRNYVKFGVLSRNEITFAHLLKEAGYATCVAGKWQLGQERDSPQHFGFDESLLWQHTRDGRLTRDGIQYDKRYENPLLERNGIEESYQNGEYAPDLMVDFICDFIVRKKEQPFLVYYPMILTHCPFVPTPDSKDWNPDSIGSSTYEGNAKYFGDAVTYMDKLVGRIVRKVKEQDLLGNTVILFTGDNGTDKPIVSMLNGRRVAGGKSKTTDAGTRVPLIASGPAFVKSSVVSDLVDFSDFLPTVCEIAGVKNIEDRLVLDGQSFLPQLRGEDGEPRQFVYCWFNRKGKDSKAKVFARTKKYKLYRNGTFFDVHKDVDEMSPLRDEHLDEETMQVKAKLQSIIDDYGRLRVE